MNYILVAIMIIAVIITIVAWVFTKLYKKYKNLYEQEHEKLLGIQEEYSKLIEAYNIKKRNKEKADEKIDNLHSGKLSADDILPKRKG